MEGKEEACEHNPPNCAAAACGGAAAAAGAGVVEAPSCQPPLPLQTEQQQEEQKQQEQQPIEQQQQQEQQEQPQQPHQHQQQGNNQAAAQRLKQRLQQPQPDPPKPHGQHQHEQQQQPYDPQAAGPYGAYGAPAPPVGPPPQRRILLLFDLNGVLTEHTPAREEAGAAAAGGGGQYKRRQHVVRPHLDALLRLRRHFDLGIYSSATARTVQRALSLIHNALGPALRGGGGGNGGGGGASGVAQQHQQQQHHQPPLFAVVLHRDHCGPDPFWAARPDGRPWSTVKPLAAHGFDVRATVLVDNDYHKSVEGEEANMLLMPDWLQEPVSDTDLPVLAHLAERLLAGCGDVRAAVSAVVQGLVHARRARFGEAAVPLNVPLTAGGTVAHGVGLQGVRPALLAEAVAAADEAVAAAEQEAVAAYAAEEEAAAAVAVAEAADPRTAPAGQRARRRRAVQRLPAPPRGHPGLAAVVAAHLEAARGIRQREATPTPGPSAAAGAAAALHASPSATGKRGRSGASEGVDEGAVRGGKRAPPAIVEDRGGAAWSVGGQHLQQQQQNQAAAAAAAAAAGAHEAFVGSDGSDGEPGNAGDDGPMVAVTHRAEEEEGEEQYQANGNGGGGGGYAADDDYGEWEEVRDADGGGGARALPGAAPTYPHLCELAAQGAAQGAGDGSGGGGGGGGADHPPRSRLHDEIAAFAALAAPSDAELALLSSALDALNAAAAKVWPNARVLPFGSQAGGLALPGSDLDLVVVSPGGPTPRPAEGFAMRQRRDVASRLHGLKRELKRRGLLCEREPAVVITARIPIIKATLLIPVGGGSGDDGGSGAGGEGGEGGQQQQQQGQQQQQQGQQPRRHRVQVDISYGALNGAAAVAYTMRQVRALPPLRPIVLAAKAVLKEAGLNEVFRGGLSSYSLLNCAIAHLQCEGLTPDTRAAPLGPSAAPQADDTAAYLAELRGADLGPHDLGALLAGFFRRFGSLLSPHREAVSVAGGGVVPKRAAWFRPRQPGLLAVEDPQQAGRDIAAGSVRIAAVQRAFAGAADALERTLAAPRDVAAAAVAQADASAGAAAASGSGGGGGSGGNGSSLAAAWLAVQADGASRSPAVLQAAAAAAAAAAANGDGGTDGGGDGDLARRFPLLSSILTMGAAVGRGEAAAAQRKELSAAAAASLPPMPDTLEQQWQQHQEQQGGVIEGVHGAALGGPGIGPGPARGAGGRKLRGHVKRGGVRGGRGGFAADAGGQGAEGAGAAAAAAGGKRGGRGGRGGRVAISKPPKSVVLAKRAAKRAAKAAKAAKTKKKGAQGDGSSDPAAAAAAAAAAPRQKKNKGAAKKATMKEKRKAKEAAGGGGGGSAKKQKKSGRGGWHTDD